MTHPQKTVIFGEIIASNERLGNMECSLKFPFFIFIFIFTISSHTHTHKQNNLFPNLLRCLAT